MHRAFPIKVKTINFRNKLAQKWITPNSELEDDYTRFLLSLARTAEIEQIIFEKKLVYEMKVDEATRSYH